MITCRFVEDRDRAALHELGRAYAAEMTPWLTFDPDRCNSLIDGGLRGDPAVFVAEDDDQVVGLLVAARAPYAACSGFFVNLFLFYVRPDKRGTRAAAKLFAGFNRWAELQQAEEVFASMTWGDRSGAGGRWIRRFGFEPAGQHVMRRRLGTSR